MNRKELLDGIANFRHQLISERDAEIKQFDENSNAFIQQVEELTLFDLAKELRKNQEKFKKKYFDFYKKHLDALDKKEIEINEGKLDQYLYE